MKRLIKFYNLERFSFIRCLIQYVHKLQLQNMRHTSDKDKLSAENFDIQANFGTSITPNDGMKDYPITRPTLSFDYLSGLVHWLSESDYSVISYKDLEGIPKFGEESDEFNRWITKATQKGQKAILLQYDVDANFHVTLRLLDTHISLNTPANVMIFAHKIFDWKLKKEGIVEYDNTYQLDLKKLEKFQKAGGVIGYHCNAFDRAAGNEALALEIFEKDIEELRKNLDIHFFSMHGGHITPEGKSNATLNVHALLRKLNLTWVHNGHSVYFHRNWADGGASNPKYRQESNDPLDFILSTQTGQRTRLLFHPQYYHDFTNRRFEFPVLQDSAWVQETQKILQEEGLEGRQYWQVRYERSLQQISRFEKFFEYPDEEKPVFINGLSRSGTTLLVSMFDAHPEGAMAYESYPRYLYVPSNDGILTREDFIYAYQCLLNYPDQEAFKLLDKDPLRNLRKFAAVTSWTGMTTQETGQLLRTFLCKHGQINDAQEALKIVAASARFKLHKCNAKFWGTKCQGNFDDYFALWPKARFVHIMRHGLDILASQKVNGSFNPDPKQLGKQWFKNYTNFQNFKKQNPQATCITIKYENLANDPERVMKNLCSELEIDYHQQMVYQYQVENTLIQNPRGQLSVERIKQPIDKTSIGRWRQELSDADIWAFLEGCGSQFFKTHEYEWKR
jgi:hypothetical protein